MSERLGHSSVNITLDTYSHVLPDLQRDAAEALDRVLGPAMIRELARSWASSVIHVISGLAGFSP